MMTMCTKADLLRTLRAIHLYIGVLIAPALLFFAFTGALQTFGLHENSRDGGYKAPRWAVMLGQIHKKQTAIVPVRRPSPEHGPSADGPRQARMTAGGDAQRPAPAAGDAFGSRPPMAPVSTRHPLPLRIFFLIVSLSLAVSSITGVYMTFLYKRKVSLIAGLLLLGTVLPVVLLFV